MTSGASSSPRATNTGVSSAGGAALFLRRRGLAGSWGVRPGRVISPPGDRNMWGYSRLWDTPGSRKGLKVTVPVVGAEVVMEATLCGPPAPSLSSLLLSPPSLSPVEHRGAGLLAVEDGEPAAELVAVATAAGEGEELAAELDGGGACDKIGRASCRERVSSPV